MKARIKDVPAGCPFDTLLTGRRGVVRAHEQSEVLVWLDKKEKRLHPMVLVDACEVTH